MAWLSERKNAALLCFGLGGVLALLLIIYAPVRMNALVLDGRELLEMGFHCAEPKNPEEFVYVKDEQMCAELEKLMDDISLRRVRRAVYVMVREPIYIVDPVVGFDGVIAANGGSFTVDAKGAVYSDHVQYRPVNEEDGLALYQAMEEMWQQVNP